MRARFARLRAHSGLPAQQHIRLSSINRLDSSKYLVQHVCGHEAHSDVQARRGDGSTTCGQACVQLAAVTWGSMAQPGGRELHSAMPDVTRCSILWLTQPLQPCSSSRNLCCCCSGIPGHQVPARGHTTACLAAASRFPSIKAAHWQHVGCSWSCGSVLSACAVLPAAGTTTSPSADAAVQSAAGGPPVLVRQQHVHGAQTATQQQQQLLAPPEAATATNYMPQHADAVRSHALFSHNNRFHM